MIDEAYERADLLTYIDQLEAFVRAYLWNDSYTTNDGATAWTPPAGSPYSEHNQRVTRCREALAVLPPPLWDEIGAEQTIIYAGLHNGLTQADLDRAWQLLRERGLINGEPRAHYQRIHR